MDLDERIFAWQRQDDGTVAVTCDGEPVRLAYEHVKVPDDTVPDWGVTIPADMDPDATFEERFAFLRAPRPGVDLLAVSLALLLADRPTPELVAGVRNYLLQLPPPAIMADVKVQGQHLRIQAGMPAPVLKLVTAGLSPADRADAPTE